MPTPTRCHQDIDYGWGFLPQKRLGVMELLVGVDSDLVFDSWRLAQPHGNLGLAGTPFCASSPELSGFLNSPVVKRH